MALVAPLPPAPGEIALQEPGVDSTSWQSQALLLGMLDHLKAKLLQLEQYHFDQTQGSGELAETAHPAVTLVPLSLPQLFSLAPASISNGFAHQQKSRTSVIIGGQPDMMYISYISSMFFSK